MKKEDIRKSNVINASEIGQFHYCSISWYLQKLGYKPDSKVFIKGNMKHEKLGEAIDKSKDKKSLANIVLLIGILFLILSFLIMIFEVNL